MRRGWKGWLSELLVWGAIALLAAAFWGLAWLIYNWTLG